MIQKLAMTTKIKPNKMMSMEQSNEKKKSE